MSSADEEEEKAFQEGGSAFPSPYKPPPQFKTVNTPPLLPEWLPENGELWLVRIQDNHLKPDECKGKQVALTLDNIAGKLGSFENSKGSSFEFLDLKNAAGVQPFAFLPDGDSSFEVRSISCQVAIVRSPEPITLSRPSSNIGKDDTFEIDGISNGRSLYNQKQVPPLFHKGKGATSTHIKEEGRTLSASVSVGLGGFSALESLQDDEGVSTGKLGKSSKKSKRDKPGLSSEVELSPLGSSRKGLEVYDEQASSKKKSRKHKKKQEESG